ncbi:hypothetical protein ABC977_08365 [Thioalkalicoccus limnaeus]|uniref:Uncharacterized protein n=1 Tax=Thioalkalicoccus limnaeus TaxID=120681 RepID=A0ABV4BF31_9GAMM
MLLRSGVLRAANPVNEIRDIGLMGEVLPAYLNALRALEPRQFNAVEKTLKTILPQIDGIDFNVNDLGEVPLSGRLANGAAGRRTITNLSCTDRLGLDSSASIHLARAASLLPSSAPDTLAPSPSPMMPQWLESAVSMICIIFILFCRTPGVLYTPAP